MNKIPTCRPKVYKGWISGRWQTRCIEHGVISLWPTWEDAYWRALMHVESRSVGHGGR